jgi:hypothetical protein
LRRTISQESTTVRSERGGSVIIGAPSASVRSLSRQSSHRPRSREE